MYCEYKDLYQDLTEAALLQLSDDTAKLKPPIEPDNEQYDGCLVVINKAISDASVLIDSHMSRLYITPLNPVPEIITVICRKLAVCDLQSRRLQMRADDVIQQKVKQDRADMMKLLADIRDGRMTIGADMIPNSAGFYLKTQKEKVFNGYQH